MQFHELEKVIGERPEFAKYKMDELIKYKQLADYAAWLRNNNGFYMSVYSLLLTWVSTDAKLIPLVSQSGTTRRESD